MALYLSLSLLAVILATSPQAGESRSELAVTLLLTTLGLLIAHILAFAVSSRLVSQGQLDAESRRSIGAQAGAGLVVAVVVTLPIVLQSYVGEHMASWGVFAAGALLVSAPVMALFYLAQRQLVSGLTAGGVKG